ncbi:MAG TPA: hypothetical protein VLI04_06740 [Nocardioidaceae bacterium]|nr:hypothetical protein [Nocardioidaceae bacterium]
MPSSENELRAVEQVVDRLSAKFATLPAQRVSEVVEESYREFDGAPIRDFVPIFVEKTAADRLARLSA